MFQMRTSGHCELRHVWRDVGWEQRCGPDLEVPPITSGFVSLPWDASRYQVTSYRNLSRTFSPSIKHNHNVSPGTHKNDESPGNVDYKPLLKWEIYRKRKHLNKLSTWTLTRVTQQWKNQEFEVWRCSSLCCFSIAIWSNYSDLTRPHPKR